ncbi:MAG: glycogen/starch/alpha-glucan phosphorylase [Lachnospiraceae bacterium]|nr:glycogen/starch/alpha-glucan phosphorylase [Lachnospiraceae bacterium]
MAELHINKDILKKRINEILEMQMISGIEEASPEQIYRAVSVALKEQFMMAWTETQKRVKAEDRKMVYYMSMEFLMGRALGNNLINLGAQQEVRELLDEYGIDLNTIEEQERDWALGNGGLGRLAACFLDSLASLGYPAYGCGIRYQYGMFRQKIEDGFQKEVPDAWLKNGNPFEVRRESHTKEIHFGGYTRGEYDDSGRVRFIHEGYYSVLAVPYDMPVIGYKNGIIDTLRIWSAEPVEQLELSSFDAGDYAGADAAKNTAETICKVLYPNDNHYTGKELRLKQQYFFVSATLQRMVERYMETHDDIHGLPEKVCIQMNDTHPAVSVAELMRILLDDYDLEWDEAWDITTKTCAYTNHTIMAEASEKWPIDLFSRLLPRIYQIVDEINRRFVSDVRRRYPGDESKIRSMAILYEGQVRMAPLAIVGSYSVNGVAKLHTEILEKREFKDFFELMPWKFSNKTNGITQRRFLLHGNPLLAEWITKHIGEGWITDLDQLRLLLPLVSSRQARDEFMEIKRQNKLRLAAYIKENNGIDVNPDSIFDVQVKRLHEYKRQLLNILHVMYLYNKLDDFPDRSFVPRTFIFGAKASSGYKLAKLTIKLINNVAKRINADERIQGKLKVVFIEDYRVSNAEIIFAASDVSEQISTASKEASGTGNMKFMLNGAVTLGTMDGANVEIVEEVGRENAFIFGMSADEVMAHEHWHDYDPMQIFRENGELRRVIMQLVNGFYSPEDPELFRPIYNSLLTDRVNGRADTYFTLKDFASYAEAQERVEEAYKDRDRWAVMALMNTACAGKFSSDRTIEEYVRDIWHLEKMV